jgi:hypothetical protein
MFLSETEISERELVRGNLAQDIVRNLERRLEE